MSIIFRIGLLSTWVVAITADFEYSPNLLSLQYQKIPQIGDGTSDFQLVNENVMVRFERTDPNLSFPYEMDFDVQTKRIENQFNNPRPKITPECNGLPGLWVKRPIETPTCSSKLPCFSPKKPLPPKLYCYHGVNFQFSQTGRDRRVLDMSAVFYNATNREVLFFIMPVFTPPVEEVNRRHAEQNNILRNLCLIPSDQFDTEGMAPRGKDDEEKHHFVGNLVWLKEVLPRATRLEGKHEWYYPGPVIIERELYNNIIGLDHMFYLHAYGNEPVRRGPEPRILKSKYYKFIL